MKTNLPLFARRFAPACSPRKLLTLLLGLCFWCTSHGALPGPWQSQDVGSVGAAGSASYSGTTFTVTGAGAEVYNAVDAFRFVYQAVSGDCTVIARVATEQNTSQWAKVGVMIRESLANNAAYSFVFLTPDQPSPNTDRGILFESRATTGASATQTSNLPGFIAPYWLKLTRAGNTFTAARSTDGITWTTIGTQTLSFTSSVLVGLVVCSHADPTLNTSTFDNVSVSNGLPSPWTTWDVGAPGAVGSATSSGGTFTVTGAGAEVYGTSGDAFRYVYQTINGDATITARVATEQNTSQWAKVGVMFRAALTDNAAYSFLFLTPDQPSPNTDRGILFESRASAGANATQAGNQPGFVAPYWLRLVRSGNTFTGYRSTDGIAWTIVGTQTLSLPSALNVGLVVCSHSAGVLNTSTFTDVSVSATSGTTSYPRLGIYAIGGDQGYPAAVRPVLAKFHVVIMGGNWESWASGRGYTREDVVAGIKSASAIGTKVFQYVNFNESRPDGDAQIWFPTFHTLTNTNNWWLYNVGTSGTKTASPFNSAWWLLNMTAAVPVDPLTGLHPYEAAAKFAYDEFYAGAYTPANSAASLDGFFIDNVFWQPRVSGSSFGDWDRNNSSNNNDAATQLALRTGEKDYFVKMSALMPGKIQLGNNADWPNASTSNLNAVAPLNGVLSGGTFEGAIGKSWSIETTGGTASAILWYRYLMDTTAAPKLELVVHSALTTTGADPYDATAYRAMRYGLAFTLMNDGYYNGENDHSGTQSEIRWFDEYSVFNGVAQGLNDLNVNAGIGYLGQPVAGSTGAVQTSARWTGAGHGSGVWAREYQNGLVIMNPKGNGSVTITTTDLGGSGVWKRISGAQAPSINNGASVTSSITLADRDGIILLRQ